VNRAEHRAMLAALPPGVTQAERNVLTALALHADDDGRCWPGGKTLEAETGLSARGLQDAFARLAKRGLEVRVPVVPGASGRGAFSGPGRRREFRLPKELLVTASAGAAAAGQAVRSRPDVTNRPPPAQTGKPAGQQGMVTPGRDRTVTRGRDRMVTSGRDPKVEQQKVEQQKKDRKTSVLAAARTPRARAAQTPAKTDQQQRGPGKAGPGALPKVPDAYATAITATLGSYADRALVTAARLAWQLAWQQGERIPPVVAAEWAQEMAPVDLNNGRAWVHAVNTSEASEGGLDGVIAAWAAECGKPTCDQCGIIGGGWHRTGCPAGVAAAAAAQAAAAGDAPF
jgi:hypothetical protein